jgi:hypothetical protein
VRDGSLKHKEDIVDGLENAPEAFLGMLDGKNFGKLLVPGELSASAADLSSPVRGAHAG